MFCSRCGVAAGSEGASYCQSCGASLGTGKQAPVAPSTVTIDGVTYRPGSGQYADFYAPIGGGPWVTIDDGQVSRATKVKGDRPVSFTVWGWVLIALACIAAFQGLQWYLAYEDLEAKGNMFAGALGPLFLGAFAVAAGFGIGGSLLLNHRPK